MKHKTAELEGALLDAAVALAEGARPDPDRYCPSVDWISGGAIIERERIALVCHGRKWDAAVAGYIGGDESEVGAVAHDAPTPLVAAMRAYVTAKLGEEVDLLLAPKPVPKPPIGEGFDPRDL